MVVKKSASDHRGVATRRSSKRTPTSKQSCANALLERFDVSQRLSSSTCQKSRTLSRKRKDGKSGNQMMAARLRSGLWGLKQLGRILLRLAARTLSLYILYRPREEFLMPFHSKIIKKQMEFYVMHFI
jgi:hypothetical protein